MICGGDGTWERWLRLVDARNARRCCLTWSRQRQMRKLQKLTIRVEPCNYSEQPGRVSGRHDQATCGVSAFNGRHASNARAGVDVMRSLATR